MRVRFPAAQLSRSTATFVIGAVAVVILPAILLYPLSSDNAQYECMAITWCRYGGLPYLGSWAHNFPGTVAIHAVSLLLFGASALSFRLVEYAIVIGIMILLYRVSRLWLDRSTSSLAIVLFSLLYVSGPVGNMGQTDGFALLPLLGATLSIILAFRHDRTSLVAIAGALYAISVCLRPTYGLLWIVPLLTLFPVWKQRKRKMFWTLVASFCSIFLITLVPFILEPNGLRDEYFAVIRYNFDVYNPMSRMDVFIEKRPLFILLVSVLWGAAAAWRSRRHRLLHNAPTNAEERRFILFTFVALLLSIYTMRRAPTYHFIPLYVFSLPIAASLFLQFVGTSKTMRIASIFLLLLIAAWWLYPWDLTETFLGSRMSLPMAYATCYNDSDQNPQALAEIAAYIQQHTLPEDHVAAIDPAIQWQISRPAATRFTMVEPLISGYPLGTFTSYQQAWQREFVRDIARFRAKYIILPDGYDAIHHLTDADRIKKIPGFEDMLQHSYRVDTVLHGHSLYVYTGK